MARAVRRQRRPRAGPPRLAATAKELAVDDPWPVAETCGRELGIAFSEGWRVAIGGQSIVLAPSVGVPTVELADHGTPPLDAIRCGVRWVRAQRDREHGGC